jgi:hypothetical protein
MHNLYIFCSEVSKRRLVDRSRVGGKLLLLLMVNKSYSPGD